MAAISLSNCTINYNADKTTLRATATATAADTIDFGAVLNGRSIANVRGSNVSDGATLAYTYTAAGVVTVPAGPSSDSICVIIDFV